MIPATIRPRQNFLNGLFVFGSGRDALLGLPRRPSAISTPPEEVSILVLQNSATELKKLRKRRKQESILASFTVSGYTFTVSGYVRSFEESIGGTAIAKAAQRLRSVIAEAKSALFERFIETRCKFFRQMN